MKHQDPRKDLEAAGLRAKKSWGQNFLRSEAVLSAIAEAACSEGGRVLEIGAGLGHLTQALLAACGARDGSPPDQARQGESESAHKAEQQDEALASPRNDHAADASDAHNSATEAREKTLPRVVAIERDRDMVAFLKEKFAREPAVEIREENALTFDYGAFARNEPTPPAIAGNLPYHLTSPILFRLLEVIEHFSLMVIMVQREVGERMMANPGSKTYGALSALVQARAEVKKLCNVPRGCFYPVPKVDSVVLTLRALPGVDAAAWSGPYRKTVNAAFSARRKTLKNALSSAFPDCERALAAAGISPERRAETLSVEDFWKLSETLGKE